jgi:tetratricopeptide (TPR) repeat protein
VRQRIADAMARGSYQRAREDAKALYKQEPNAEHHRYLVEATIGRAVQMQQTGQPTEAVQLLTTIAADVPNTPGQFVPYVNAFLLAGDWQTADRLIGQVTDAGTQAQLAALCVDHAVLCDEVNQDHLPVSFKTQAQCVLQALADWEQGNDTAANDAVAAFPDDSPWHDWKILIRGLTAFYGEPDTALTWWRQLDAKRAPAMIAAPFRGQIDKAFHAQHPRRPVLASHGQQVYEAPWITALERVQQALLRSDITTALHHARRVNSSLPADLREVGNRLSRMLYWQVARLGDEDDIKHFSTAFGALPDDPSFNRLRALIDEQDPFFLDDAQTAWARYEQDLLRHDIITPASDRDLARSLLWLRMGEMAEQESPTLPGGLAFTPEKRSGCAIDALQCLRRSVELAPQHLAAHEALLGLLYAMGDQAEIMRAAQALLTYFPEHDKALAIVADDAYRHGRWEEAVALQTRALRTRPHEAMLQSRLHTYQLAVARFRAQQGQFDDAREILASCLKQMDAAHRPHLLCRMAAVELKAGHQREGERLFEQACEAGTLRLVTVFQMLIESVRMPVDAKWIQQMDREFRRGLKAKVHGPSAVEMIKILAAFATLDIHYDGFDVHRELVLQYLKRSRQVRFSEDEFITLCHSLPKLDAGGLALEMVKRAIRSFPRQPVFQVAFATYYLDQPPEAWPLDEVDEALHKAEELVYNDPHQRELAQKIAAMLTVVHAAMEQDWQGGFVRPYDDDDDDDDDIFGGDSLEPRIFDLFDKLANLFGAALDDDPDDVVPRPPPRRRKNTKKRRR